MTHFAARLGVRLTIDVNTHAGNCQYGGQTDDHRPSAIAGLAEQIDHGRRRQLSGVPQREAQYRTQVLLELIRDYLNLARLEGGAGAAVFASGLAAMAAVVATLGRDDRVVLAKQCYFGVRNWLRRESERVGFEPAVPEGPRDLLSATPACDFKCLLCAYERIRGLEKECRFGCLAVYRA